MATAVRRRRRRVTGVVGGLVLTLGAAGAVIGAAHPAPETNVIAEVRAAEVSVFGRLPQVASQQRAINDRLREEWVNWEKGSAVWEAEQQRLEAERQAREEAERQAREEAERIAREEAERAAAEVSSAAAGAATAAEAPPAAAPAASFADRVRGIAARYGCGWAGISVDDPRIVYNGKADCHSDTILIRSTTPPGRLEYVVAHECVHLRQYRLYGGDVDRLVAEMNAVYGGSGFSGVEQNADCVTQRWGIAVSNYTTSCGGARGQAAAAVASGHRGLMPYA